MLEIFPTKETRDEYISPEDIKAMQQEAFEKYGVDASEINKPCKAKNRIIQSKEQSIRDILRKTFPELMYKEMCGLTMEQLMDAIESTEKN